MLKEDIIKMPKNDTKMFNEEKKSLRKIVIPYEVLKDHWILVDIKI